MSDANSTILSIQPGDVLQKRYRLERILGRGGMGIVWKAFDTQLEKFVAIKLLPPEVCQDGRALERLKAEARRGQSLAHPGIVSLHDFQLDPNRGNAAFLVMEFVEGRTLSDHLKDHPRGLPLKHVLTWAQQLATAIDFAHEKRILHRDIKPGNIMIDASGNARLIDFGIGREVRNTMTEVSQRTDSSGTPAYMSPQQLMGENHPTNDIYSLAATLYECLCGSPPFRDGHVQMQILHKPASAIPGQPDAVNAALHRGLAKSVEERPASARALAESLATPSPSGDRCMANPMPSSPEPRRGLTWVGWLVGGALLVVFVIMVQSLNHAYGVRSRQMSRSGSPDWDSLIARARAGEFNDAVKVYGDTTPESKSWAELEIAKENITTDELIAAKEERKANFAKQREAMTAFQAWSHRMFGEPSAPSDDQIREQLAREKLSPGGTIRPATRDDVEYKP